MLRKVFLPAELSRKLNGFTKIIEEVDGFLFYRKQEDRCPIEALFIAGVGNAGDVRVNSERLDVVSEFFKRNSEYRSVKFYTYSREAIGRVGQDFLMRAFREEVKERLECDGDFMSLAVTPEAKVLEGTGSPQLLIVPDYQCYLERSQIVNQSLGIISKDLGHGMRREIIEQYR